ncbi:MAG: VTT domain-containing protein [Actinomycetota bacterium]|nr:VTT domain-containing protein [Actinomycetota bacterium]
MDLETLITTVGLLGVFGIVFAETGLLVGFFLPGDSLLFTTGLLVSHGILDAPLVVVLAGCFLAAVVGDQVGYAFGRRVGPRLFRRPDSRFFRQEHVAKAHAYFERYGARTIVLARFVPVVRTFAPVLAGVGSMRYRTFVTYNVVGALLWGVGVTALGYALGRRFPHMEEYLLPTVVLIIAASLVPVALEWRRSRTPSAR